MVAPIEPPNLPLARVPSQLSDLAVDVLLDDVTHGDLFIRGASAWNNLPAGPSGHVLTSGGPGAAAFWQALGGAAAQDVPTGILKGVDDTFAEAVAGTDFPGLSTPNTFVAVQAAPFRDKGGAVWHVKHPDFGARGDGVTDDTAAINAAIAAASSAGGGIVKLPPGTYLTKGHALPSNVSLDGSGRAYTKLLIAGDTTMSAGIQMVGVNNASTRYVTVDIRTNEPPNIDGIAVMTTATDGTGTPCTFCTIEFCQVLGWDTHQYLIWSQMGQHIKILFNWIDGNVFVRNPSSQQEAIEVQGGIDVLVMGNTITNMGNSGIDPGTAAGADGFVLDDLRIIGNSINGANIGISVNAITGPTTLNPCSRVKILGNTVQNVLKYGCWLWSTGGSALVDIDVSHNTFDGIGSLSQSFTCGFFAEGDSFTLADPSLCRDVRFTDNLIRNVTASSAGAGANFAAFPRLIFARNTIRDITTGTSAGIASNSPDVTIVDNTVDTINSAAVDIQTGGDRTIINRNKLRTWNAANNNSGGVLLDNVSYCEVRGNSFYQPPGGHDHFPVAPQANCSNLTIAGNVALYSTGYDLNPIVGEFPGSNVAPGTGLYWDHANNRLGINNSAPTKPIDLTGDAKISGALTVGTSISTASVAATGAVSGASAAISGTITATVFNAGAGSFVGQIVSLSGSNAQFEINSQDGEGGAFSFFSPTTGTLAIYAGGIKLTFTSAGDLTLTGNVTAGAGKALKVGSNSITWGAAAPSSGTWVVGDVCWNTAKGTGLPEYFRCSVAGTPGTWRSVGSQP